MGIRLIHVPPGAGNISGEVFKRINSLLKSPDYSGFIYITYTEDIARERLKAFHEMVVASQPAYIPPEITTLRRLSSRLCSFYGSKLVLSLVFTRIIISAITKEGMGLSTLIAGFIKEAKQGLLIADADVFGEQLKSLFEQFDISDSVFERVRFALNAFKEYESLKASVGIIDEDDAMLLAPRVIEETLSPEVLVIDGLLKVSACEKQILRALILKSAHTIIAAPTVDDSLTGFLKENFSDLTEEYLEPKRVSAEETCYHPFPSLEEEVEGIARRIKTAFISGEIRSLDKTVVAFPNLQAYSNTTARIFKRYGIPMAVEKRLSDIRAYLDVLLMLESIVEDYPRLAFSGFLTSPYFTQIPQSLKAQVPRVMLSSVVIKGRSQWLSVFDEQEERHAMEKVFKKLELLEKLRHEASYSDYLNALYGALRALGFSTSIEGDSQQSEFTELKEHLRGLSLIDKVTGKKIDLRGFVDSLRHIFDRTISAEKTEGVRVVGLNDAFGLEPEMLCLGGLRDGELPSMPETEHLLPEALRARLGFGSLVEHLAHEEFIFENLRLSAKKVFMTYPTMESEKLFLPSLFLRDFEKRSGRVHGVLSPEEKLLVEGRKNAKPFSDNFSEITVKEAARRYRDSSAISVTEVDDYRNCPRRFFINKILGLEAVSVDESFLEAKALGSAAHKVMEMLSPLECENIERLGKKASEAFDKALEGVNIDNYWKNFLKEAFVLSLPKLCELESEIRAGGYEFKHAEYRVEGEPILGLRLKGKIDRIDAKGTELSLIDYKTNSEEFNSKQLLLGRKPVQLFLYAAVLKAMGENPTQVGLYSITKQNISWIPNKADRKTGRCLDEYIEVALRFSEDAVKNLRAGLFKASPLNDESTCRECVERPYCPYIQGMGD